MRNLRHIIFYEKTKILVDFHICISVPLNPLCSCSIEVESTSHYFLRCYFFDALLATLMNDLLTVTFLHLEMKILQISYYTVIRIMTTKQIK